MTTPDKNGARRTGTRDASREQELHGLVSPDVYVVRRFLVLMLMLMLMFVFVFGTSALVPPEARVPFWCQGRRHGFRYAYRPVFRTERYVPYMHNRVSVRLCADFRCGQARSIECIVSDSERRRNENAPSILTRAEPRPSSPRNFRVW